MKNPAPYLRRTIKALLDGNVTYNSEVIPVYEKDEDHDDELQIAIGYFTEADTPSKHGFMSVGYQEIEIISYQTTGAKKIVDAIGELVMNDIHPTVNSEVLSGVDFQIVVRGKPTPNYPPTEAKDNLKIVRLIQRYHLFINEK